MQQPPSGMMTPASMAAAGRAAESDASASNARWKAPSMAHQMSGAYRNIVVAEKRRRANELAAKDLNATLKQETLDGLRQKAHDLQNDRWMYEDVHL